MGDPPIDSSDFALGLQGVGIKNLSPLIETPAIAALYMVSSSKSAYFASPCNRVILLFQNVRPILEQVSEYALSLGSR